MRMVPECANDLLESEDCAFAVSVASVAHGSEMPPPGNAPKGQVQLPRPGLDLEKWCCGRLGRSDAEKFGATVVAFVQASRSISWAFFFFALR